MIKFLIQKILPIALFFSSCTIGYDAQRIIDKTIAEHGGELYKHIRVTFDFRDTEYIAEYDYGKFMYQREMQDSVGVIVDRMTNDGFTRTINGDTVAVTDEEAGDYSNSINSVVYFALLPYKLNDEAVIKEYIGQATLKDEPYYKIRVGFKQEGGGEDHEDTFIYWIHRENYTMDYFAYRFHVDGGGTRFREAYNIRTVNGIRFADYHNYGGPDMEKPLEDYDDFFKNGELEKVSEVNLENINVEVL